MVGRISAQLALLAFATAISAGLLAGNTPVTVLTRALLVMVGALFVGQFAAWTCKLVLRDHLQRSKIEIDRRHLEELDAIQEASKKQDPSQAEGDAHPATDAR